LCPQSSDSVSTTGGEGGVGPRRMRTSHGRQRRRRDPNPSTGKRAPCHRVWLARPKNTPGIRPHKGANDNPNTPDEGDRSGGRVRRRPGGEPVVLPFAAGRAAEERPDGPPVRSGPRPPRPDGGGGARFHHPYNHMARHDRGRVARKPSKVHKAHRWLHCAPYDRSDQIPNALGCAHRRMCPGALCP